MAAAFNNLAELIQRGGVVMIPLLVLSVIALALILERAWFWLRTNRPRRVQRVLRITTLFVAGDARATQAAKNDDSSYGRVARSLLASNGSDAAALAAVESIRPQLERWMVTLSTIVTAAPLLGILGTVLGIIESFDLLGQEETLTDPRRVSSGIAEALLTTALGLIVALVTLFPYMVFRGQIDRTMGRLEVLIAAIQTSSIHIDPETQSRDERTTGGTPSSAAPSD